MPSVEKSSARPSPARMPEDGIGTCPKANRVREARARIPSISRAAGETERRSTGGYKRARITELEPRPSQECLRSGAKLQAEDKGAETQDHSRSGRECGAQAPVSSGTRKKRRRNAGGTRAHPDGRKIRR